MYHWAAGEIEIVQFMDHFAGTGASAPAPSIMKPPHLGSSGTMLLYFWHGSDIQFIQATRLHVMGPVAVPPATGYSLLQQLALSDDA